MALARTRRGESGMNYWPGFVDALSTLILSIIFLLTVFVVVQFYLQQEVQGKNAALLRLNGQVSRLADLLSMEKASKADLQNQFSALQASLANAQSETEKYKGLYQGAAADATAAQNKAGALSTELDKYKGLYEGAAAGAATAQNKVTALSTELEGQKGISTKALAEVDTLNEQIAALRQQLVTLNDALGASQKKEAQSQEQIATLGERLNVALAQRVQELSAYRSDFFGKLREILGNRPDIRVVGDRFVLQSEVFFDTGRADLKPEGRAELDKVADAVVQLESQIPANIPWVLRVDGHTDARPITTGQFKSNWDLSAARALSVVKYLIEKQVDPTRLVAAGFGQFEPIDTGTTEDAYRRNRRIEFKLTER